MINKEGFLFTTVMVLFAILYVSQLIGLLFYIANNLKNESDTYKVLSDKN